jgi:hypothetical protein
MILGVINQQAEEHFTVADTHGNLISGIDSTAFTIYIYNPSGIEVSASVSASIVEIGNGSYKLLFTPNVTGTWYINVTHPTYFPWGKNGDVQVYNGDLSDVYDNVIKTLGLVHHNFYIDNTSYDEFGNMVAGRVRIYSDSASVGSDVNVIETYLITADGTACGRFNYWTQIIM